MASWLIIKNATISTELETGLRNRYGWRTWVLVLFSVLVVHYVLFGIVHNLVDMRVCAVHLPDPLYRARSASTRAGLPVTVAGVRHRCGRRSCAGCCLRRAAREATADAAAWEWRSASSRRCAAAALLLLPACRATIPLATPGPLHACYAHEATRGFIALGIRGFAVNDLVFSGHTGLFLLFLYATPAWPRPIRSLIACFTLLMVYALLATREHYTIDILLAAPCSFFADRMALELIGLVPNTRTR